MNKSELVTRTARITGASREDVLATVDAVLDVIASAVRSDEVVQIARFGKFEVRSMPERRGRNPRTGEPMTVPAYRRVVFRPFSDMHDVPGAA